MEFDKLARRVALLVDQLPDQDTVASPKKLIIEISACDDYAEVVKLLHLLADEITEHQDVAYSRSGEILHNVAGEEVGTITGIY
jgi:hypothetical protein